MEVKTFQKCLEIAENAKGNKHLMLGNGFSIDIFSDIFNYARLAERVTSEQIKRLFSEINTNDFEYVMQKLTDALQVVRLYPDNKLLVEKIASDLEELKTTLIDVINKSHPANPQTITDDQYSACYQFLKHFEGGKKYTFNYDLLLYWVYMHFKDNTEHPLKSDDGFRHPEDDQSIVTWEIGREIQQNLYYVHGAMHIFSDGSEVEKYTWINSGKTISEQVRDAIDNQKYPVFIAEGSKNHKIARIQKNSYLGRSFSSIKSIRGNLFIFGHSLRDEDDHVFDYVNSKSRVKNIFISIFGDKDSQYNQAIIEKINNWKNKYPSKKYYLFDSATANVWGNI